MLVEDYGQGKRVTPSPADEVRVLVEWIDRTLSLPVYQSVTRDSYGEGVVETLRTVRRLLAQPSERDPS